ncbi:hypothetical protein EOD42_22440 [Rhodovarius crocodyli]|uniref:Phage tail protein n=1 Tax=Rhodovarius crocodyli TaxID=1979269 RepID=A0A437M158_9PROT|nr:hypothetical protein [Rhodovarius crocodyli]RVT91417.1 hypothetical protein EOD42_22440 [Rhodovarius crocodyli]
MPIFFNGRLITTPTVASRVDDSAMFNANPAVGNVLTILGRADAGEPKKALRFGSASEAAAVLRGGELLDAVSRAFGGMTETPGPSEIIAVRVQPATGSTLALKDSGDATVINLASSVYGTLANRLQIAIAAATTRGKKITTKLDSETYEADNVGRQVANIRYSGNAASATVTINSTTLTLSAPTGTTVATLDLATFATVADLVDRISLVSGWTASVADGSGEHPTAGALDFLTGVDAKTADLPLYADLQAVVDWINGTAEPLMTATKVAGAGNVPTNITSSFLAGGSNGNTQVSDWAEALTMLQSEDTQWVVPVSGDAAVHALVAAHVKFMSDVMAKERRAIVGTALSTTDAAAIAAAKAINSDRVGLVHLGVYDYNTAGKLTLFSPYIAAAILGGGFAGVNPGTALTNKALSVRGLERKLRNPTDTDVLLRGGVIPLEDRPTGYFVVQSISTWLTNTNYNRRELSTGAALDYAARALREAMQPIIGKNGNAARLAEAKARATTVLNELARAEPQGLGVLAGDADNPAWKGLKISISGDVLRLEVQASPVIPINYIPIVIFAQPYSGSVAA